MQSFHIGRASRTHQLSGLGFLQTRGSPRVSRRRVVVDWGSRACGFLSGVTGAEAAAAVLSVLPPAAAAAISQPLSAAASARQARIAGRNARMIYPRAHDHREGRIGDSVATGRADEARMKLP